MLYWEIRENSFNAEENDMEKKNNRKILEYFTCENKEHWLREIQKSDWGAGQYLYSLSERK